MNMSGPGWLADIFAAVMLAVALSSTARIVVGWRRSRPIHLDVEVDHLLMGVAMAGMFVTDLNPLPAVLWEIVFSLVAAWFVWRCLAHLTGRSSVGSRFPAHHVSHYPSHLVMALAMLYMYFASGASSTGAMGAGMAAPATGTTANFVGLPLLFLLVLMASCTWELDRAGRRWQARLASGPASVLEPAMAGLAGAEQPTVGSAALPTSGADGSGLAADDESSLLAPGVMAAAHVAMCVAMGYMLIVML